MGTPGGIRPMKKTLGDVIKRRRMQMNLSQRQLAQMLGVKASHVGYLEHGQRRPSLSLVSKIAESPGLKKDELFLLAHPDARSLVRTRQEAESTGRPATAR